MAARTRARTLVKEIQHLFLSQQRHAETLRGCAGSQPIVEMGPFTGDIRREMNERDSRIVRDRRNDLAEVGGDEYECCLMGGQPYRDGKGRLGGVMNIRAPKRFIDDRDR